MTADRACCVAELLWPGVLDITEFASGLFWVVSRDHGGIFALVDDLTAIYAVGADAVAAAQAFDLVHTVALNGTTCGFGRVRRTSTG